MIWHDYEFVQGHLGADITGTNPFLMHNVPKFRQDHGATLDNSEERCAMCGADRNGVVPGRTIILVRETYGMAMKSVLRHRAEYKRRPSPRDEFNATTI